MSVLGSLGQMAESADARPGMSANPETEMWWPLKLEPQMSDYMARLEEGWSAKAQQGKAIHCWSLYPPWRA